MWRTLSFLTLCSISTNNRSSKQCGLLTITQCLLNSGTQVQEKERQSSETITDAAPWGTVVCHMCADLLRHQQGAHYRYIYFLLGNEGLSWLQFPCSKFVLSDFPLSFSIFLDGLAMPGLVSSTMAAFLMVSDVGKAPLILLFIVASLRLTLCSTILSIREFLACCFRIDR